MHNSSHEAKLLVQTKIWSPVFIHMFYCYHNVLFGEDNQTYLPLSCGRAFLNTNEFEEDVFRLENHYKWSIYSIGKKKIKSGMGMSGFKYSNSFNLEEENLTGKTQRKFSKKYILNSCTNLFLF